MSTYKERALSERIYLDIKLMSLINFIASSDFSKLESEDQDLITLQLRLMHEYSECLSKRITRFYRYN